VLSFISYYEFIKRHLKFRENDYKIISASHMVNSPKGSSRNKLYFCLAIFGRIASLQIACLAELNGALCASHCIPNPAVKMHSLLLYEP